MASFDDIIKEKLKNLQEIPDDFVSVIEKKQKVLLEDISKSMGDLTLVDGKIEVSEENIAKIEGIINNAKSVFFDAAYLNAVKGLAEGLADQAKLTQDLIRAGIGPIPKEELFKQILKATQVNAVSLFEETIMDAVYFTPLREQIFINVTTGASMTDAIASIRNMTIGTSGNVGDLERYAKTWSRTTFAQGDATYTTTISREMGVEWYLYAGGVIELTRPFCETRHNKYYHISEVEGWGKLGDWTGKIKGTNSRTIFSNRGGWNCIHSLAPVSVISVPKSDVIRAIEAGIYKPDDAVKKNFKIAS